MLNLFEVLATAIEYMWLGLSTCISIICSHPYLILVVVFGVISSPFTKRRR